MHQCAIVESELLFRNNVYTNLLKGVDCWRCLIGCKRKNSTKSGNEIFCVKILNLIINVLHCIIYSLGIWFYHQKHVVKRFKFVKDCSYHLEDFLILHFTCNVCKSWYINHIYAGFWCTACLIYTSKMFLYMLWRNVVDCHSRRDRLGLYFFLDLFLCHSFNLTHWKSILLQ